MFDYSLLIPLFALFSLSTAFVCYIYSLKPITKRKVNTSMSRYKLIYTDQNIDEPDRIEDVTYGTMLYSGKYDIQGKPDYIFESRFRGNILPVEIKSGEISEALSPHKGDLLQLVSYFLIIEDVYGKRPKVGRLLYKDYMFIVRNTFGLRREVRITLSRMREMLKTGEEYANSSFVNCRYCLCNGTVCEYAIEYGK